MDTDSSLYEGSPFNSHSFVRAVQCIKVEEKAQLGAHRAKDFRTRAARVLHKDNFSNGISDVEI